MLNARKNSLGTLARTALLAAVSVAFGSLPAIAVPLDASLLASGPVDWILRAEAHPTLTFDSALTIGTPPGGDSVSMDQGCFPAIAPLCPARDFLIEIRAETIDDGDDKTYDITFGARDNEVVNGLLVSEFYIPNTIATGFGPTWTIGSNLPTLAATGITGRLILDASPASATSAEITLDAIALTVSNSSGGGTDNALLDLSTAGADGLRFIDTNGCQPIDPRIAGVDLDLSNGDMTLIGRTCLTPNAGQFLTYRVLGTVVVPEPGTLLLAGGGLIGLGLAGRRRRA